MISGKNNEVTFCLDLPSHMQLHPVFHCSLLQPCVLSGILNHVMLPPPAIEIVDGSEYEVATILDSKIRGHLYYLVDWEGYGAQYRTWELDAHLVNAHDLIQEFHNQYP